MLNALLWKKLLFLCLRTGYIYRDIRFMQIVFVDVIQQQRQHLDVHYSNDIFPAEVSPALLEGHYVRWVTCHHKSQASRLYS